MKVSSKLLVAGGALALLVFVAQRETSAICTPVKVDGHGHGHGHAEESDGHAQEGFAQKVCEDGLVTAVWETVIASGTAESAKADGQHSEGEKDHDHGTGGDNDRHAGHSHGEEGEGGEGFIKLTPSQIKAAGIGMQPAASGRLVKEIAAPGRVVLNADAQARIVSKLTGTVASVTKQLGDQVAKGDILATIESREMADAKADYLAAMRAEELAQATFEREERLWKQKVTAEQEYLTARNAHAEAKIKRDVAHQRLHAIGLTDDEIKAMPKSGDHSRFRIYELRTPISGQVTARDLVLGQTVSIDKEVFTIADPSKVWVEIAIAPNDLTFAQQGQNVRIRSGARMADAKIIALSPVIDPETRSAKAIAELDNAARTWKPGDYVEARLVSGEQEADIIVPSAAVQTIKGNKVVFVNEAGGFRMRPITTGREDSTNIEIISGLEFGETVATSNTFTLKAELGKAEAEHAH